MDGPFFNLTNAAEYCGYAPETFRKYLKVYKLPRHGPKRTRFAKSTLDEFMETPDNFSIENIKKRASQMRKVGNSRR